MEKQKSAKRAAGNIYLQEGTIKELRSSIKSIFVSGPYVSERLGELEITIENLTIENQELSNFIELTPILRSAVFKALSNAGSILLEPIYQIIIQSPPEQLGIITSLLNQYQAKIIQVEQLEYVSEITAHISVRAYISFSEDLRSKTSGRAFWQTQFHAFSEVPESTKDTIIQEIKFRRGIAW